MNWREKWEGKPAGWIAFPISRRHTHAGGELLALVVPLDCAMQPIPVDFAANKYSNHLAQESAGSRYYPDFWCRAVTRKLAKEMVETSLITLEMMKAGCCPPLFIAELMI